MAYDPTNHATWLQLPPDYMAVALLSEFNMFLTHVRAIYHILLIDPGTQDVSLHDGTPLCEYIQEQTDRLEDVGKILLAASVWKTAYREGKVDLGDYPKPPMNDDP